MSRADLVRAGQGTLLFLLMAATTIIKPRNRPSALQKPPNFFECDLNRWTQSDSGAPCWDSPAFECATCVDGGGGGDGCQCGIQKAALCVECGTNQCETECIPPTLAPTSKPICKYNRFTAHWTGEACWFDSKLSHCARCHAGGCGCGSGNPYVCKDCSDDSNNECATKVACVPDSKFTNKAFVPPTLYRGGKKSRGNDYGGTRVRSLPSYKNWYISYDWDWELNDTVLADFHQFHLVVLHHIYFKGSNAKMMNLLRRIQVGSDGIKGTADDVAVLMYISIGEQSPSSPLAVGSTIVTGDGSGPVYFTDGHRQYNNTNIAPFYIGNNDKLETHGTWGGYYIDTRDAQWRSIILDEASHWIDDIGFDGIFLDAPEVGDPWNGRGWAADGILDVIRDLDNAFPSTLLLLNRGLFYFVPHYSYQFDFNPAKYIDFVLFESFQFGSDYGDDEYKSSPYYKSNRDFNLPKILAELSRPDSFAVILQLDYFKNPSNAASTPVFGDYIADLAKYGALPFLTDKEVSRASDVAAQSLPPDADAPTWSNTSNGFNICDKNATFYNVKGMELPYDSPARVGARQVIRYTNIFDNSISVRWDLAVDQTRPIRYNVYLSNFEFNLDFDSSNQVDVDSSLSSHTLEDIHTNALLGGVTLVFPNIHSAMPTNYKGTDYKCGGRTFLNGEEVYPFEWTLSGLPSGTYSIVVRAEDSTSSVKVTNSGRHGPNGGIEEVNIEHIQFMVLT
eukprot:CAMPEP_0194124860 /NCGR_PEP_ID=MMETSP0150-20130528/59163_1 /TAXON_ID=122233 /ORGANISM="Chaetoceros debilis, Strain MM31A-1" /LENGTH=732 /DNA_ID=CAMNT_0038818645 /DNA_START=213 /DNA_END=2411 /DNA_ORIENTATION=-